MTELAPQAGALMVALARRGVRQPWRASRERTSRVDAIHTQEHRYYGASIPPAHGRTGAARLRHLSSQQAVGDIATFHSHISQLFDLPSSTKWVSWGGSYPGMVAGFSRLRLPHLIYAAVSSSAPRRAAW